MPKQNKSLYSAIIWNFCSSSIIYPSAFSLEIKVVVFATVVMKTFFNSPFNVRTDDGKKIALDISTQYTWIKRWLILVVWCLFSQMCEMLYHGLHAANSCKILLIMHTFYILLGLWTGQNLKICKHIIIHSMVYPYFRQNQNMP